jgi:hypothetical protein
MTTVVGVWMTPRLRRMGAKGWLAGVHRSGVGARESVAGWGRVGACAQANVLIPCEMRQLHQLKGPRSHL